MAMEKDSIFDDKILLITGGTGSFGNTVVKRFLDTGIREIRIFSRDEKKQNDMRLFYNNDKLKFYIGDVRDLASVDNAMDGVDYVFHAAALKQVPSCEFFPVEAIKTNCLGVDNVLSSAIKNEVKNVVVLSTDKAAYPINAMGMSKGLMEKVAIARSRNAGKTTINVTRYGNVMGSRGSVIPLFLKQIAEDEAVTITSPKMTRFMMTLPMAVDLVLFAFKNGNNGDLFIQKAPAATVETLVDALYERAGKPKQVNVIGVRHGEKDHEVLITREEMVRAEDMGGFYRVRADERDLNYSKYGEQGDKRIEEMTEYGSHNTRQLDVSGMIKLLDEMVVEG
jgi:UDP-glucose 4-epimerase